MIGTKMFDSRRAMQRVELFRRNIGGFGLAGFADASRLDEFRMHLVDQPGAEDHWI